MRVKKFSDQKKNLTFTGFHIFPDLKFNPQTNPGFPGSQEPMGNFPNAFSAFTPATGNIPLEKLFSSNCDHISLQTHASTLSFMVNRSGSFLARDDLRMP